MPILSRNYASSKWCLVELTKMVTMASKSDSTKEILPIYLHVNSDDIKLKTPLYHDAFVQHERNFGADQVKVWRDALMEVEEIKRWSLKTYIGYGKLIKEIVQEVLIKLNARYKNVTEHLVEDHVQIDAIMKLLEVDYSGVRFVGVHGIGGIGKTTLAKVIYNKLYSRFDRYSFLENVQEISRRSDGIIYLQKQLLSSILHSTCSNSIFVRDNDQGIGMIKKALCDKKILIVLDDVEKKEQLKKLVGKSDWFENGSRVIITTRNMSVLTDRTERLEVDAVPNRHEGILTYEVKEMRFSQALQLFCRHSFRRDFPTEDYNILSRQIILILGSCLWLSRVLLLRSLINIGDDNKFSMHDQVRDLGRHIVYEENCRFPGKRSGASEEIEAPSRAIMVKVMVVAIPSLMKNYRDYGV
ncbi:disease resistance protein RPV1-like [Eucalyptus grandis]|uniref:disease resistance protein RPV1-like n=1 Tax=Eucalyptus grandis TaxID=71139 RepID=UPI00192E8E5A|nr:disease resistance protein RPV1-like [Eucalyptus grandis]